MPTAFVQQIRLDSFLSFAPGAAAINLQPLNVIIGPNGAGKSNLIEAFELLRSTPTDFANAIRLGGGAEDWLWKGQSLQSGMAMPRRPIYAKLDILMGDCPFTRRPIRYQIEFTATAKRLEILDEAIEETRPVTGHSEPFFYYRF